MLRIRRHSWNTGLEDSAGIDLAVRAASEDPTLYTAEQATRRAAGDTQLYDRMWEFLLGDDDPAPAEVPS